jgi:hypothetical protein
VPGIQGCVRAGFSCRRAPSEDVVEYAYRISHPGSTRSRQRPVLGQKVCAVAYSAAPG